MKILEDQLKICRMNGVEPVVCDDESKLGIASNVCDGLLPINGLRHPPAQDTCGWYIWAGEELSQDPSFFRPLHVAHLSEWCPAAIPYLALPPGWRFLIAPGHEDVWYDESLLHIG